MNAFTQSNGQTPPRFGNSSRSRIRSSAFMRFVIIRFSEHLDVDIPPKDGPVVEFDLERPAFCRIAHRLQARGFDRFA